MSSADDRHIRRGGDEYAAAFSDLLPPGTAWPREPDALPMKMLRGLAEIWGSKVDARAADLLEQEVDPRTTLDMLDDWERAFGLPDSCFVNVTGIDARRKNLVRKMTILGAQSRAFFTAIAAEMGYQITIHEWSPFMCGISELGNVPDVDTDPGPDRFAGLNYGATDSVILVATGAREFAVADSSQFDIGRRLQLTSLDGVSWLQGTVTGIDTNADIHIDVDAIGGDLNSVHAGWNIEPAIPHTVSRPRWEIGPPEMRFYWTVGVAQVGLIWFRVSEGQSGVDPHLTIIAAAALECLFRRWKPAHTEIIFDYSGLELANPMAGTP